MNVHEMLTCISKRTKLGEYGGMSARKLNFSEIPSERMRLLKGGKERRNCCKLSQEGWKDLCRVLLLPKACFRSHKYDGWYTYRWNMRCLQVHNSSNWPFLLMYQMRDWERMQSLIEHTFPTPPSVICSEFTEQNNRW